MWALSVLGGLVGLTLAAAPTGNEIVDRALCALLVAFVVWAGSTARTWLLIAVSGSIGVLAIRTPVVGVAALAAAVLVAVTDLWAGRRRWVKALASGITAVAALHLPEIVGFGGSAIAAAAALGAISLNGVHMKRRSTRRRVSWIAAGIFAGAVAGAAGVAVTLVQARDAVEQGEDEIRAAVAAANEGDISTARTVIAAAEASLSDAERALARPWGRVGAVIPVLAQHRSLALDITTAAHDAATAAAAAIDEVDLDQLRLSDGQVDLQVAQRLGPPFAALSAAVDEFSVSLDAQTSPWLFEPVRDRIDEVAVELDTEGDRLANLAEATRTLPELLGDGDDRRYFVAFITPSEARALGGHMANYAELTFEDGRLSLSEFGRAADLIEANADRSTRLLSGPDAYLDRYGPFGAGGDGVASGTLWWLSVTISPDFPSVAQVMSELYEQGTGRDVDGVIAVDPSGLAALLRVVGPVDVPALGRSLDADNVVDFLQHEQYTLFTDGQNEERTDLLGDIAHTTFDRLVGGSDLDPVALVRALAPAATGGHVLLWSPDRDEQRLFEAIGAAGSFARQGSRDGLAVTNLNGGANKLDAFLRRTIRYDAIVDEATGALTGTVEVTLHNDAPAEGLPAYVIGNSVGDPTGSNRTYLTLYTPGPVSAATVDGVEVVPTVGEELGWQFAELNLVLPAGSTTVVRYELTGSVDPTELYELLVRAQPMATPDELSVSVRSSSGRELVTFDGTLDRTTVLRERS